MSYRLTGDAIGPNGNVNSRIVSEEPMSIILNLGFSQAWTEIDWAKLKFPTTMHVDYVRWYQKAGESSVTCDPPGYETTEYIKNHPKAYYNNNLTVSTPSFRSLQARLTINRAGIKRATDGRSTSSTAIASTFDHGHVRGSQNTSHYDSSADKSVHFRTPRKLDTSHLLRPLHHPRNL